jgi:hypothetical protein
MFRPKNDFEIVEICLHSAFDPIILILPTAQSVCTKVSMMVVLYDFIHDFVGCEQVEPTLTGSN